MVKWEGAGQFGSDTWLGLDVAWMVSGLRLVYTLKLPYLEGYNSWSVEDTLSIHPYKVAIFLVRQLQTQQLIIRVWCKPSYIYMSFVLPTQWSLLLLICCPLPCLHLLHLSLDNIVTSFDLVTFKFTSPGNVPHTFPTYFMKLLPETLTYHWSYQTKSFISPSCISPISLAHYGACIFFPVLFCFRHRVAVLHNEVMQ